MSQTVPHAVDFKLVQKISSWSGFILWCSAIISLVILVVDISRYGGEKGNDRALIILNSILSMLAVTYFVLDVVENYKFQKAEDVRRSDFIDNSFGTTIADVNSQGYFSNDSIGIGAYKLGVNCFENCMFTKEISNRMIPSKVFKSALIVLLYLSIALFTEHKVLALLLQVTLPFTILQQTIKLILFNARIKQIYVNFKAAFSYSDSQKRDAYLFYCILNYETTLSWGGISLDSNVFNNLNATLSAEWTRVKTRSGIN